MSDLGCAHGRPERHGALIVFDDFDASAALLLPMATMGDAPPVALSPSPRSTSAGHRA
jgi:hypothetical protein